MCTNVFLHGGPSLSMAPQALNVEYTPLEGLGNCAMCTFSSLFHMDAIGLITFSFHLQPIIQGRLHLHFMGVFDHTNGMVKGPPFWELFIQIWGGVDIFMAKSLSQHVLILNAKTIFWTTLLGSIEGNQPSTKGHFTHETESPWPLHFKHSHWWKSRCRSKFASHYAWGTDKVCERKMDVKSTWIPTWHRMDHVSWSLGLFLKTTSWRWA